MMRLICNFLALTALTLSLLFGIFDIARSVAQSRLVMMGLLQGWQLYWPELWLRFSDFISRTLGALVLERVVVPVLLLPAWCLFLALSLLLLLMAGIGASKRKSHR